MRSVRNRRLAATFRMPSFRVTRVWIRSKRIAEVCRLVLAATAFAVGCAPVLAQKLPPTSGTAFKCEVNGKVTYSDAPCLGGTKVDTTPTRGVNKLSGRERIGSDVRGELTNEMMADALKPLFGENGQQRATRLRRSKLELAASRRCYQLDDEIPVAEKSEARAHGAELERAQRHLLELRRTFFELRC